MRKSGRSVRFSLRANYGNAMCKHASAPSADGSAPKPIVLPTDTTDSIVAGRRLDFLKLDVEGSDLEALQGASATLRQRPLLVIELHCFAFHNREQTVREILASVTELDCTYEIQPDLSRPIVASTSTSDLFESLVGSENPHLYCLPRRQTSNKLSSRSRSRSQCNHDL